jgi:tripartite ATP-independent transporter DctP family solute receptor
MRNRIGVIWKWGMAACVITCLLVSVSAAQQKVALKASHLNKPDSVIGIAFDRMADLINKNSGGSLEMKVFAGGVLGQEREMIEQLKGGALDVCIASPGTIGIFEPSASLLSLPFIYRDVDHVRAVTDGPLFAQFSGRLLKSTNVRSLVSGFPGFRYTYTRNKALQSLEDFKGMKIRVPASEVHVETFKALGANPTPIAFGEIYTSLQTGVVEGMENINEYVYEPKLHEQLKFASRTGHMFEPWQILISETTWQKMNEAQRKVVMDAALIAWKQQREAQAARNLEFENKLKEAGMKFNDINRDPLRQATEPVRQKLTAKVPGGVELVKEIMAAK